MNTGIVLFDGQAQGGTLGGLVDLLAQVKGAPISSYSGNTTNLNATGITGTNTYHLHFQWPPVIHRPGLLRGDGASLFGQPGRVQPQHWQ